MTTSPLPVYTAPAEFGIVRLKLLLALCRSPELDTLHWHGMFTASIGPNQQVKAAAQRSPHEIRLEDSPP